MSAAPQLINKWAACALAHTRSEISFQLALAASRAMTLSEIALWRRCFAESERLNCRCLSLTMVFGKSDLLRHHGPTLVLIMWQRLQLKPPELNHNMLCSWNLIWNLYIWISNSESDEFVPLGYSAGLYILYSWLVPRTCNSYSPALNSHSSSTLE